MFLKMILHYWFGLAKGPVKPTQLQGSNPKCPRWRVTYRRSLAIRPCIWSKLLVLQPPLDLIRRSPRITSWIKQEQFLPPIIYNPLLQHNRYISSFWSHWLRHWSTNLTESPPLHYTWGSYHRTRGAPLYCIIDLLFCYRKMAFFSENRLILTNSTKIHHILTVAPPHAIDITF